MYNLFEDEEYLAYLEEFITENRKINFERVLKNRTNYFTVAVEDLFQLHNTSAVMRSCEVFGIQELHVVEEKFGKTIDKEIALGAEKWVDIHRYKSNQSCIDELKARGYQIVATTPHENDCTLDTFDFSKPSAFFFGTERLGLSQEVLDQADCFLKIPMVGFTESLNISVSAAIIIQHVTNALRQSDIDWKLKDKEILAKKIDWSRKTIKDFEFVTKTYLDKKNSKV